MLSKRNRMFTKDTCQFSDELSLDGVRRVEWLGHHRSVRSNTEDLGRAVQRANWKVASQPVRMGDYCHSERS